MKVNYIDTALRLTIDAHAGALDIDGNPSILHPIAVGMMGDTDEEKMAGFLHCIMKDTQWSNADLRRAGIPVGVVNALDVLTFRDNDDFYAHIQSVIDSGNPIALRVKSNDLKENIERYKTHADIVARCTEALEMIEKAIKKVSQVKEYKPSGENGLAIFACGCFWGAQYQFSKEQGVLMTSVGYTGGEEVCPSYEDVRNHRTSHVEAVAVEYDPKVTSYIKLCQLFFEIHDPAQTDGVGPDIGEQYRSCIFYRDEEQKKNAEKVIADLRSRGYEVNTLLLPSKTFYSAEEYHQDYYGKTGGAPYCHIREIKF